MDRRKLLVAGGAAGVIGVAALMFGVYGLPGSSRAADATELTEEVLRQAEAAASDPDAHLYAKLEQQLKRHPEDGRALVLKARLDMGAQRYEQAAAGFEKALANQSKVARDAGVWVEYAEARGMLQGRSLLGEPQKLVEKALAIDAAHPQALDLAGSAAWEARDFGKAAAYWKLLLEQIPRESPRHAELSQAIERAQQRGKVALPPSADRPKTAAPQVPATAGG